MQKKFYLPTKNNGLAEYNIIYMERDILDWINKKSLQLGGKCSNTYYDKAMLNLFWEPSYENGRIDVKNIYYVYNRRHDFWNGEQYDEEERTEYTVYYDECKLIQSFLTLLNEISTIFPFVVKPFVLQHLRRYKIEKLSLDAYFQNDCDKMLSFQNLVPYLETELKEHIESFLSLFQLKQVIEMTYLDLQSSIQKQIEVIANEEQKLVSFPLNTSDYENMVLGYVYKCYTDTLEIAKYNQKVLEIRK